MTADLETRALGPLVEAAREWAEGLPNGIVWLLGTPAAGKSTWLRALAIGAPAVRQLELAAWLAPFLRNDGATPGASAILESAVALIRTSALLQNSTTVVSATQLPRESLASMDPQRERIVVLTPSQDTLARQRLRRPERPAEVVIAETERLDAWQAQFTVELPEVARLTVPVLPELLPSGAPSVGTGNRTPIAAVIGPARCDAALAHIAEAVGEALVNAGFRIATGGMGGVMEAASKGAHRATSYRPGDVIGILPTYDNAHANPWVDVPIATGLQHARNVVVVGCADVVVAIGGQAGTLSELALAWTLGRHVICVADTGGWSTELAGRALDGRRNDMLHGPCTPAEAAILASRLVGDVRPAPWFE